MGNRVPWVARTVFRRLLPEELREEGEGDLVEGFARVHESRGAFAAHRWAWRQVFSVRPFALRRAFKAGPEGRARARRDLRGGVGSWTIDLRHALRSIRARPGASVTIALTVALALGATTAVFSVVQGVLLTPLSYPESERLVRLWQTRAEWLDSPNRQLQAFALRFPLSTPTFNDWAREDLGFDALGAYTSARFVVQQGDGAEVVSGQYATSGVLKALGVAPHMGRLLLPEDDVLGAPRVAVLSFSWWRDRYGSEADILGRSVSLDGAEHTIVGVLPSDFEPLSRDAQVWAPLPDESKEDVRDSQYLSVVGRLAPGVTLGAATERLSALQVRLAREYPDTQMQLGARAMPLLDAVVGDVRSTLWFLFGSVALVLLIASANIANILSVVGLTRRREMAVKTALGASTRGLVRGLFLETVLLSTVGGALGMVLAWQAMPVLMSLVPPSVPRHEQIGIDGRVLLFGLGVSLLTAVLVGILPALQASRTEPQETMRAGGGGSAGDRSGNRTRSALVVSEVALAFVLLTGATVLGYSFHRLWTVDRGFATESLVMMSVVPDPYAYPEQSDEDRFLRELRHELEVLPGLEVSATNQVPLGGSMSSTTYLVERSDGEDEESSFVISVVLENYFDVMRIPIVEGRGLQATDILDAPEVAVVSASLAEAMWPGESALGKRLRRRPDDEWSTVVGVARDVRHSGLEVEAEPNIYVSAWQNHRHPTQWVLRGTGDPAEVIAFARDAVAEVSLTTPVQRALPLEERISASVAVPRFRTLFVVGLAAMAALLALLGVYGVMTFSVTQRTREIGVRMALGAERSDVVWHVVRRGLELAVAGIVVGALITLLLADTAREFTYGIEATHPGLLLGLATAVAVVSAAAAYLPARRAAAVEPMSVLKSE